MNEGRAERIPLYKTILRRLTTYGLSLLVLITILLIIGAIKYFTRGSQ